MNARFKSERGMSLVEATIILMVLAVLTSVVAPSVADYVEDSRHTKAKEDVEALGTSIIRVLRDTGLPCLSATPGTDPCTLANRVDLLVSSGNTPAVTAAAYTVATAATIFTANVIGAGGVASVNWVGATASGNDPDTNFPIQAADRDTFDSHLVTNGVTYTAVSFTGGGGPRSGLGWRGAYVSGPIGADPWGFTYQANTVFLTTATNADDNAQGEGQRRGGWKSDVVVISPGGNGSIQTLFGGTTNLGSQAVGDDVVYTIQGATR